MKMRFVPLILVFLTGGIGVGSADAQSDRYCSIAEWKKQVRASLRSSPPFGWSHCSNVIRLVNEDLGFGQRALHWAVLARNWALTKTLLEVPSIDPMQEDDDQQTALGYLLADPGESPPEDLVRLFAAEMPLAWLEQEIDRFASLCLDTFEETTAFKRTRLKLLLSARGKARSRYFYVQLISNLASADARCFSKVGQTYAIEFLTEYAPSMTQGDLDEISQELFDSFIYIDQNLSSRGESIGFFDAFIRHPVLDRDFPEEESFSSQCKFAKRVQAAARVGSEASVRYLIEERNYPINFQDDRGNAVLFSAVLSKSVSFAPRFLEFDGLDMGVRDEEGKNVLFFAVDTHQPIETIETILDRARTQGVLQDMLSTQDENSIDILEYVKSLSESDFLAPPSYYKNIHGYLRSLRL